MADQGPEPLYDDQGQHVGWGLLAEDGAIIGTDTDGNIVHAEDPETGEALDPAGYGWSGDDEEADPYAEYDQRIAQLEQQAEEMNARPLPSEVQVTRGLEKADVERVYEDMDRQAEHLEKLLGRPLLISERRRLAAGAMDDIDAGDARPNLIGAADRLAQQGKPLLDLDDPNPHRSHAARTEFMVQRLEDQERRDAAAEGLDDLSNEKPPPSQSLYDLDDANERHQWMAERMEGRAEPGSAYSSSEIEQFDE